MLQIRNHNELANSVVVPYLLNIPDIYNLSQYSGKRYQYIEDVLWQLLWALDIGYADGVWLDYLGRKVGQSKEYAELVSGAFTFGGTTDEGFGAGQFGTYSIGTLNTEAYRSAIRSKIIQNYTNASFDELKQAIKLLFNVSLVRISEDYPAGIDEIHMYGRNPITFKNAAEIIKSIMPVGVSLNRTYYHALYNIFKNDAFIQYNKEIDGSHDFRISFSFVPDTMPSETDTGLLGIAPMFGNEYVADLVIKYNKDDGVYVKTTPSRYSDETLVNFYTDENLEDYLDGDYSLLLKGDSAVHYNERNQVVVDKTGNTWSLYVNGLLVAQQTVDTEVEFSSGNKIFLGNAGASFYNSGAIYDLLITDNTTNQQIIYDRLQEYTVGTNNGVRFL